MHTISKILNVTPYKITVVFDNSESREIDFQKMLDIFPVLKEEQIFRTVKLDDYPTLSWENAAAIIDYDGEQKPAALDFCPDSLYALSTAVKL